MSGRWRTIRGALLVAIAAVPAVGPADESGVRAPGAKLVKAGDGFEFTEGPTPDPQGNVYFSDVRTSRTYKWSPGGEITPFRENTGNANGLALDEAGNLLACEGGRGRVVAIDPQGRVHVVADSYRGKPFNQPNDLWIDPKGGLYFSDPIYGRSRRSQDGEHVYYVSRDRKTIIRVIDDMVRPNGLVGTPDGKTLYVTDHGAKRTYRYDVAADGTLANKRLFAPVGADGMKLDTLGNLYVAEDGILIFDPSGRQLERIEVPEQPTNLCFAGPDRQTLFITARSAVYTLRMRVRGAASAEPRRPSHSGSSLRLPSGSSLRLPSGVLMPPVTLAFAGSRRPTSSGVPVLLSAWASRSAAASDRGSHTKRPNFVVILGEGHGWSSTSVQMDDAVPQSRSATVRTPNLESLAQSGMRFANFYAPSPRCTPSRAALLTGISPAPLHMTFVGEGKGDSGGADASRRVLPPRCLLELPEPATTIAEALKRAGYATAHFGKWHLGRVTPGRHGFDESDGPTSNGGPDNVDNPHPKQLYGMTQRGLDFITRQAAANRPFYLQLSHYASRKGGEASPEALAAVKSWGVKLTERELAEAAADFDLDLVLGLLLKGLQRSGVAGHTYVFFTTDHGTPGRNPPLAGGKGGVWEGGLRVPFIVRGPGVAAGACTHVRATGVDLFPTIAQCARVAERLPGNLEGGSLAPVFSNPAGGAVKRPREEFVFHFPHYDHDPAGPASAILLGGHKLIHFYETDTRRLFDLASDPGERSDLAPRMPDKVRELDRRLGAYLQVVGAQMPLANPSFDPNKAPADLREHKNPGKGGRKAR